MKIFLVLLMVLSTVKLLAFEKTVDLYNCHNVSLDVYVKRHTAVREDDSTYKIVVEGLSEKTTTYSIQSAQNDYISKTNSFIGLSEVIENNGVLGLGLVLNINLKGVSILALDGAVHTLICTKAL